MPFRITIYLTFFILGCLLQVKGQGGIVPHIWTIKYAAGGAFTNNFALESERRIGNHTSITFRGAITNPVLRTDSVGADGFFTKVGIKYYLNENHSALAIKPEVVYTHRRDYQAVIRGPRGELWEDSFGILFNLSYSKVIKDKLVIEPFFSVGYIPTWESYTVVDDVTFESTKVRFVYVEKDEKRSYYNSHFSILGNVAIAGGINLGITF